jgi:hypothetical protein
MVMCTRVALAKPKATPQAKPQGNSSFLGQLDAASAKFHNVQVDVQTDDYTQVARDHDLQTGSMYVERNGASESMGGARYTPGAKKPYKIYTYDAGTLQVYSPGMNQVEILKAGANHAKYESFLTLGFGGSGKDLARSWDITDLGPETISGVKTEKLDLVGKDQSVRKTFSHVTIWVDPARGISLKQIFYDPDGDTHTTTYSNIRLNEKVDKKPYAIDAKATKVMR